MPLCAFCGSDPHTPKCPANPDPPPVPTHGVCPSCRQEIPLHRSGLLVLHRDPRTTRVDHMAFCPYCKEPHTGRRHCPGSRRDPR